MKLRDYQEEKIIIPLREALRKGEKKILVVSPTGSGKTACFSYMATAARNNGKRTLVYAHRKEIIRQMSNSMFKFGAPCGQIVPGKPMTNDAIQIGSIQTIANRLNLIRRPDLIIADEAHHQTSPTYKKIQAYWSDVPIIGFTATPERLDGVGLGDCFDKMIIGPTIKDLVSAGWLSYPIMKRPPNEINANYHIKRGDFDAIEQSAIMSQKSIVGDVIEHYRRYLDGLPVIVACVSIKHAFLMAEQFKAAGYRSVPVWGNMKDSDRDAAIEGLGNGSVQVVTFCDLIGEGVDIPVLAGIILLRKTVSLSLYLQWVGRALRPYPGKTEAIILDHAGNWHIHGHVLQDREWSLESQKRTLKNNKEPQTTSCPQCYGVWPGKIKKCPECGFLFHQETYKETKPIEVIAGELVDSGLDDETAEQAAVFVKHALNLDKKTRQKALLGRAFSLAIYGDEGKKIVESLATAVGYSGGWAKWAWEYVQKNKRGA